MAAIEILGFEKAYKVGFWRKVEKVALRPLNLSVNEGEVFGFLGPNGAGKTTTLKLLMGLIFPTRGTAKILGVDWRDPSVRARVGFLPEQPYFYDQLTAAELLEYYGTLSGMPARDRRAAIPEMLGRVGLGESANLQLRKFSKGMLQRVGIAQAILHQPEVVFLDEPMSGLDPIGRKEVRDLIQWLKDQGRTIFFSTHILSDAEALCDRIAVLNKGELRGIGAVAELVSDDTTRVELVWQGERSENALQAIGVAGRAAGQTVRAEVEQKQLDAALAALRSAGLRLVSVNPVRRSLEDYFVARLGEKGAVQ
jgi:ABC-2 type transport system ATP-binding protein